MPFCALLPLSDSQKVVRLDVTKPTKVRELHEL